MARFILLQNTNYRAAGFQGMINAETLSEALESVAYSLRKRGFNDVEIDVKESAVFFTAWFDADQTDDSTKSIFPTMERPGQKWNTNYLFADEVKNWNF